MMTAGVKERLQRVLELSKRTFDRSGCLKAPLLGGILLLIGLLVAFSDHSPHLAHVRVGVLPGEAKDVLEVDTLIVSNRCARRSVTQGFITVLVGVFPDIVRYNRDTPNRTGLPLAPAAHSYFEHEGPDLLGVYVPWAYDIMPTAS